MVSVSRYALYSPFARVLTACLFSIILVSCANQAEVLESLGDAFIGSAATPIYAELAADSAIVARLDFGIRVRVVRRRRNFYFVRSANGEEGWTHRSNLFNQRQVREMNALAKLAAESPAQGQARVFATLNVHNHPNRSAPNLFQIHEGDLVSVIAHERHPRVPYDPGPLLETTDRDEADREDRDKEEEILPPSPPLPPDLPSAWLKISGLPEARIAAILAEGWLESAGRPDSSAAGELWTLVRNEDGLAGWALNSRLVPAIPEAVAQYSEGARITSYFSLGDANEEKSRQHWLWTTLKTSGVAYDFDSYRVFVWNNRLHRYETAMIARDVEGYLPVETFVSPEGNHRFRINLRERGGMIFRRTYERYGMRVRLVQSVPWPSFDPVKQPSIMNRLPDAPVDATPAAPAEKGFWSRLLEAPARAYEGIFGN